MPDYSKTPISFAEALRAWSLEEIDKLATATDVPGYAVAARGELERRARPCICFLGQPPKRDCPRHQGRRP